MKTPIKVVVMVLIFCLGVSTSFAATASETVITENGFISELLQVGKEGASMLTGSDEALTRQKAAELIVKYLGYEAISKKQTNQFKDVTSVAGDINLVSTLGIMTEAGKGVFNPQGQITSSQAKVIIGRIQNKLAQPVNYKHACYAISSSNQSDWIKDFDGVSFGWAELENDGTGEYVVSTNSKTSDFKVPSGFEVPLNIARDDGTEAYLMIYFKNTGDLAEKFLANAQQKTKVIDQIVSLSQGVTKDGIVKDFDGITIDFEQFIGAELRAPYNLFLKDLSAALKKANKKLNVMVQPTTYFKGYDYQGIGEVADHVILMAHDYEAKTLTQSEKDLGMTATPLTPIDEVYSTLYEARQKIADPSKIVIQFSFGSVQWQSQNNKVLNSNAYTPSYDKIEARLALPETVRHFDSFYQSTYATFEENGISNIVWYEDTTSIQAKMDLAKLMGITGESYWRLGIIPEMLKASK